MGNSTPPEIDAFRNYLKTRNLEAYPNRFASFSIFVGLFIIVLIPLCFIFAKMGRNTMPYILIGVSVIFIWLILRFFFNRWVDNRIDEMEDDITRFKREN